LTKTLILSNVRFPEPHVESYLSIIIKKEEPEVIVLNGDTTQCFWDYECPRVIDVLYVIRSLAPWAHIVYVQGDLDPHAPKCITSEPRYREEITTTSVYVMEVSSTKYFVLHGHQYELDNIRKSLNAGPWDWIILGQYKKLEVDRLARIIYSGGITRDFPPEARGYVVIDETSFYIRSLR